MNQYKYNGKELQTELGLNVTAMDYRQYDNAIGRFNSIDSMSELEPDKSPYTFARNNPVLFGDPRGLYAESDYEDEDGDDDFDTGKHIFDVASLIVPELFSNHFTNGEIGLENLYLESIFTGSGLWLDTVSKP